MTRLDRRSFIATSAGGAAGLALGLGRGADAQAPFDHTLHKALIVGQPNAENLQALKDAGFEGCEAGIVSPEDASKAKQAADDLGMRIHSVLRGWASFNSTDEGELKGSFDQTVAALRAAEGYGADAVLLVPCRIGGMPMPEPWEFSVGFDEKTNRVTSVVNGDNAPYADYIAAHNQSVDGSLAQIEKLIPIAEETGVVIAIENVWNNLWVDPYHFANLCDQFASEWVKIYFDLGNHVKYGLPEHWLTILGDRIVKCHVKDFKLNEDGHGGNFVDIRDGSVNWPSVRSTLDSIGYDGWMTIEGSGGLSKEEQNKRLDLICTGK